MSEVKAIDGEYVKKLLLLLPFIPIGILGALYIWAKISFDWGKNLASGYIAYTANRFVTSAVDRRLSVISAATAAVNQQVSPHGFQ